MNKVNGKLDFSTRFNILFLHFPLLPTPLYTKVMNEFVNNLIIFLPSKAYITDHVCELELIMEMDF